MTTSILPSVRRPDLEVRSLPVRTITGGLPVAIPGGGAVLSPRDRELLGHLACGRSTREIAVAMSISSNTVRTRIRRVEGKLGVRGRDQIAGWASVETRPDDRPHRRGQTVVAGY